MENVSLWAFIGIQLFSIGAMLLFLLEHRKLCIARENLFSELGDQGQAKRRLVRLLLIVFYVLTTLFILTISAYTFFQLP